MKRYRVGVVGTGFIGVAHMEALRRLGYVEVAAIAEAEAAAERAQELHVPMGFADYREMVNVAALDAVHICTPNHLHKEIALYALERGLHVVCEKPLCVTPEEADEMVDAAAQSGLVCAVNYHNRFYPMAHEMRRMVQTGQTGRILTVHGAYLQDWLLHDTDFNWRLLSGTGGKTRAFGDIGSHWVDLSEYVLGHRVCEVFALFDTVHPERTAPDGRRQPIDTEDVCILTLRYANGTVGSAVISQTFAGAKNRLELSVAGTSRSAFWNVEECDRLLIGNRDEPNALLYKSTALVDRETTRLIAYPAGHVEGFPDAFKQNFHRIYRRIADKTAPCDFASFEDGRHIQRVGEKALVSARTGTWVSV